jgi:hypothetical protein
MRPRCTTARAVAGDADLMSSETSPTFSPVKEITGRVVASARSARRMEADGLLPLAEACGEEEVGRKETEEAARKEEEEAESERRSDEAMEETGIAAAAAAALVRSVSCAALGGGRRRGRWLCPLQLPLLSLYPHPFGHTHDGTSA